MSPRPIVISVQPRHANNILDGSKVWEFRKAAIPAGTVALMYRSGPVAQRGLLAAWRIGVVLAGTAGDHFWRVGEKGGVTLQELEEYAGGRVIYRHQVTRLSTFPEAFSLRRLYPPDFAAAPQNWRYAPEDWAARLGVAEVTV